jgi:hypothetical protein
MSANGTSGSGRPPSYTVKQVASLIFGLILLLPGGCALLFIGGGIWEIMRNGKTLELNPFMLTAVIVWAISFAISAGGVALIVAARRRPRRVR